jgi:hypothetical protein
VGTLTLQFMRDDLYSLLKNASEYDPTIAAGQALCDRMLNYSYLRVQRPETFDHLQRQSSQVVPLVAGTSSYAITLGTIGHVQYVASATYNKRLTPMRYYQLLNNIIVSGPPSRYARWGPSLYLDYIPSVNEAGQLVNVFGWSVPITLAVSSAASDLDSAWDEVIVIGAAWRAARRLGEQVLADMFREEYGAMVNDAKSNMNKEADDPGFVSSFDTGDYQ